MAYNKPLNIKLLLGFCILAYLSSGLVSMLMSVYLPAVISGLLGDANESTVSRVGPWLNAAYLAGMTIGGLALGIFSDRYGRGRMLAFSLAVCGASSVAVAAAQSWEWVAFLRACTGVGVSGILVTCAVLISEQWPAKSRAVAQSALGVAFPIGIVLSGGMNVFVPEWRSAFWVGVVPFLAGPAALMLFGFLDRAGNAASDSTADKHAASSLNTLFHTDNRKKLLVGGIVYGFDLVGLWAIFSWMPTWVDHLIGGGELAGQMRGLTMMLMGMGGMAGTGLSGFLINRFGLRRTLLSNFSGTLVLCALLFLSNRAFSSAILVEAAVLALFFGVSQGALTVYITELFPSEIRASGTGFCFNIGRVFTTCAVFFVGALVTVLGGYASAMLVFSSAFLVAWTVYYFGETPAEAPSILDTP